MESFGSYLRALAAWNITTPAVVMAHCLPAEQLAFEWCDPFVRLLLADRMLEFGAPQEIILLAATGANGRVVRWCPSCAAVHPGRHLLRWEDGRPGCPEHGNELACRCEGCGWQTFDVLHWLESPYCPHCRRMFTVAA